MTWRIEWSAVASATLRAMPWRDAARVDAAVQKLAKDQEGDLVRLKDHPTAAKLRISPYVIYLNFDQFEGTLTVWFVYRQ